MDKTCSYGTDYASTPSVNFPNIVTYNNYKPHSNQRPETFQTFHHNSASRVLRPCSSFIAISQQIPKISSTSMSHFRVQPHILIHNQISFFVELLDFFRLRTQSFLGWRRYLRKYIFGKTMNCWKMRRA